MPDPTSETTKVLQWLRPFLSHMLSGAVAAAVVIGALGDQRWMTHADGMVLKRNFEAAIAETRDQSLTTNTATLDLLRAHITNQAVHMTYADKVREFVPRGEFTDLKSWMERMENKMIRVEDKMDYLVKVKAEQ